MSVLRVPKGAVVILLAVGLVAFWASLNSRAAEGVGAKPVAKAERLVVFAGAASQPATTEVAKLFGAETGIRVECSFGGSGTVLNQIRVEHYGDLYIPGSDDYMDRAEKEGLVECVGAAAKYAESMWRVVVEVVGQCVVGWEV